MLRMGNGPHFYGNADMDVITIKAASMKGQGDSHRRKIQIFKNNIQKCKYSTYDRVKDVIVVSKSGYKYFGVQPLVDQRNT